MYGRRYQRKRGFKRVVVTLLSLVMLLGVCFPGLRVNAEEGFCVTVEQGGEAVTCDGIKGVQRIDSVYPEVPGLTFDLDLANGTITVKAASDAEVKEYTVEVTYTSPVAEEVLEEDDPEGKESNEEEQASGGEELGEPEKTVQLKISLTVNVEAKKNPEEDTDQTEYKDLYDQIMACEDRDELLVLYNNVINNQGFIDYVDSLDEASQNALSEKFNTVQLTAEYEVANISITDTIKTNGCLNLKVTDDNGNEIAAQSLIDAGYTITWTKDGSAVVREEVTNNIFNLAEDGSWVNVVYDKGAQATYTVTVSKDGATVGSASSKVNYYDELQNPSFELPIVTSANDMWTGIAQFNESVVPGWNTTASDNQIEIGNVTITDRWGQSGTATNYNCPTAVDGDQIAELNCEDAGALYQDVLTEPGSKMYWKLSHRGRNGADTMALVIAPLSKVENITTQTQLEEFINGHESDDDVFVYRMTDNNTAWGSYTGQVVVPNDQYVTRFFFVAINAQGGNTQGNLLDDVWFSTVVPPPVPGNGTITVTKNIYGLTLAQVTGNSDLNTIISYTAPAGRDGGAVTFDGWQAKTDGNGVQYITANAIVSVSNISGTDSLSYTFSENTTQAKVSGYDMTADKTSDTVTLTKTDCVNSVIFTNTYTPSTTNVVVTKEVTGNMGDWNKYFTFKWACEGTDGGEFTLKNGGSYTIENVPLGKTITVTESDNEGYTVTYSYKSTENIEATKGNGSAASAKVETGLAITFTNDKDVTIDTGIVSDSVPFILLFAVALIGGGVLLLNKRRYTGKF